MDPHSILDRLALVDDISEREALLERFCGDDAAAREQLLQQLKEHQQSLHPADLPTKPPSNANTISRPASFIGQRLGNYVVLEQLGEGGMGVVYLAKQEEPVKRHVAIKVTKPGFDSHELLARFQAERQALALMDQENIAKVFEAGTTDDGRLYFAMELVKGTAITEYCQLSKLSMADRLELFMAVCRALHHAHQKGIVHRDVKPSNVLVVETDGKPVPKVIDFGLAKALEQQLAPQSLHTQHGQLLGTLEYMSPEQASFRAVDVDTRSDVYSLGVLLYELLTGTTPLGRERLQQLEFEEVLKIIRDEEPPRPSTRLPAVRTRSDTGPPQPRLGMPDQSELTRSELDLIVLKALAKDRDRRYDSPAAMAADIQRFLNHEPIEARPPSAIYLLRKFTRRNRTVVVSLAALLLTMLVGIAGSTYFAIRANREASRARMAAETAQRAQAEEMAARERAETSAKRSADVLSIVTDAFDSVDPNEGANADMSAKEVLLFAKQQLTDSDLDDEGREILSAKLAKCFVSLGEYDEAITAAQTALQLSEKLRGREHTDSVELMSLLGAAYEFAGRFDEALPILEDTLRLSKLTHGTGTEQSAREMSRLAHVYKSLGRMDEAIELYEQTVEIRKGLLGEADPSTLSAMNDLSIAYMHAERPTEGLALSEATYPLMRKAWGLEHPETLASMDTLAGIYEAVGQVDKAIPLYEQGFEIARRIMGEDHPNTLSTMNNLAYAYQTADRNDEALPLYEACLSAIREQLGDEHPYTLGSMNNLASALKQAGRTEEALKLMSASATQTSQILGADHPQTIITTRSLARLLVEMDRTAEALPILQGLYATCKTSLGESAPRTIEIAQLLEEASQATRQDTPPASAPANDETTPGTMPEQSQSP